MLPPWPWTWLNRSVLRKCGSHVHCTAFTAVTTAPHSLRTARRAPGPDRSKKEVHNSTSGKLLAPSLSSREYRRHSFDGFAGLTHLVCHLVLPQWLKINSEARSRGIVCEQGPEQGLGARLRETLERESSANQLGCTDVPGLSVTWSDHQH